MSCRSRKVIDGLADSILDCDMAATSRFAAVDDTAAIVDEQRNKNTKRMTLCHIKLFKAWLAEKSEVRDPHHIPADQLDTYLAQFILSVRKEWRLPIDHELRQYEPETLTAIHSSVHRFLNDNGYASNTKADDYFRHSRAVLSAKKKELKQLGKGNTRKQRQHLRRRKSPFSSRRTFLAEVFF